MLLDCIHAENCGQNTVYCGKLKQLVSVTPCKQCKIREPGKLVDMAVRTKSEVLKRYSLTQVSSFIEATTTGTYVSDEIREERAAICRDCRNFRNNTCIICGCNVGTTKSRVSQILDLAAYEENLPKWGCKHPNRSEGQGWKR